MKNYGTFFYRIFVFFLVIPLFAACNGTESDGQSSGSADSGTVLTDIFTETAAQLPSEAQVSKTMIPLYDRESGTVTVFLTEREEVVGEDDVVGSVTTGWLYRMSESGELLDRTEIPLPDTFGGLGTGIVLPDEVIYTGSSAEKEPMVWKYDRTTGETVSAGSVREMTGDPDFYPSLYAFDEEGRIYGTDKHTLYVLNPDLTMAFVYDFPMQISGMASGADGNVWTVFNAGMEVCAAVVDPETKELGTYCSFTRGMDSGDPPKHYLLDSSMNAGESAYNFFYYDMGGALWGVTVTENGVLEETQVFDLFNSGITRLNTGGGSDDGEVFPIAFVTDELFLTRRYDRENSSSDFVFHHRTEDIDLSEQSVITVAYPYSLEVDTIEHITEFRRTHPEVNIVLEDYSRYIERDNSQAGEEKLCFDLVNGSIEPDIVITKPIPYAASTLSDSNVAVQLCRNELYVDLVPYLETDSELNFGNLFGCVRRLFDDGEGGMWGISNSFQANTLIGSEKLLGNYAEKGCWTLSEMLDFLESLPEDTEKIYNYNRRQALSLILGQGCGYFLHDGTASFDSEEFIRFLEFYRTVPADPAEYDQTSPVAEIQQVDSIERTEVLHDAIAVGKIALMPSSFGYEGLYNLMTTEGHVPISAATKGTSVFQITPETSYIITAFSENPDLCFELVKSFFAFEEKMLSDGFSTYMPLFSRKDHFSQAASTSSLVSLERQKLALPTEWLNNAGSPILERTPTDIQNIVNEEMSVFFSGMGTAEDCARKIQSRVEIWLSEHE